MSEFEAELPSVFSLLIDETDEKLFLSREQICYCDGVSMTYWLSHVQRYVTVNPFYPRS